MIKRSTDFIVALFGVLILSPVFVLVALLIKCFDGGGPVFYVQRRVGRGGREFPMYKFRTMVVNADRASALTIGSDSRITPVGVYLRKFKIDELPQLWNVLVGDMSLVGPRPEVARFVECYSDSQRAVLALKPGVTDPASFAFFNESDILSTSSDPEQFYKDHLMPEKIRINLDYAAKANFAADLFLILATVGRIFGVKLDVFRYLEIDLPKVSS